MIALWCLLFDIMLARVAYKTIIMQQLKHRERPLKGRRLNHTVWAGAEPFLGRLSASAQSRNSNEGLKKKTNNILSNIPKGLPLTWILICIMLHTYPNHLILKETTSDTTTAVVVSHINRCLLICDLLKPLFSKTLSLNIVMCQAVVLLNQLKQLPGKVVLCV